jgi:uncharacterized protein (TIGR03000 family)
MSRMQSWLWAAVLGYGGMFVLIGPTFAAKGPSHGGHHHGHHHHGFHHGHHHHGFHHGHHHHRSFSIGFGYYPSYYYSSYNYPRYAYTPSSLYYADVSYPPRVYYQTPVVTQPAYGAVTSPAHSESAAPPEPAPLAMSPARVQVFLPTEDAELWFGGHKTALRGTTRTFESPGLESGKTYRYRVKASWNRDGRIVTEERTAILSPGTTVIVNFNRPADVEQLPPPPKDELPP